jgi:hypothetical protein
MHYNGISVATKVLHGFAFFPSSPSSSLPQLAFEHTARHWHHSWLWNVFVSCPSIMGFLAALFHISFVYQAYQAWIPGASRENMGHMVEQRLVICFPSLIMGR